MRRFKDWEIRLEKYIQSKCETRFAWGTHDCVLATCGAIEAITGIDPAEDYRGTYSTEQEAGKRIPALTVGWEFRKLGFKEIAPLAAQRGDAVSVDLPNGFALGFVGLDGRIYVTDEFCGWGKLRLSRGLSAWRVT